MTQTTELADARLFRESPLELVRNLFVGFLQGLFHAAPVGAYRWEPHEETELVVTDESPVHVEALGVRPALGVARGPIRFQTLGVGDLLEYDPQTGSRTKSVLCGGAMFVHGISRVLLESERLAWIAAEQLWAHRELLLREGMFELGSRPQIGAPSPPGALIAGDSADEYVVTTVTCPFQFYRTTRVSPLGAKIVQGITAQMRARVRAVGSLGPVDSGGADLPVDVHACPTPPFAPASDAHGHTPSPGDPLPRLPTAPHPLDPSQTVYVRVARPYRQRLMGTESLDGKDEAALPIADPCTAGSPLPPPVRIKV